MIKTLFSFDSFGSKGHWRPFELEFVCCFLDNFYVSNRSSTLSFCYYKDKDRWYDTLMNVFTRWLFTFSRFSENKTLRFNKVAWESNHKEMSLLSPKFKCKVSVDVKKEFKRYISIQMSRTKLFRIISAFFILENDWISYEEREIKSFNVYFHIMFSESLQCV